MNSRRLFVAIDLPEELKQKLSEVQDSLRQHFPMARWVTPPNMHVTLKFLDDVLEERRFDVEETISMVAGGHSPFELEVGAVDFAPNRSMIWVMGLPQPPLIAVHHDLDQNLLPLGFKREPRLYMPHITLARMGRGYNGDVPFMVSWPGYRFPVDELVLFESHLGPNGSQYEPLRHFTLSGV